MESFTSSPATWTRQDVISWATRARLSTDTIAALEENQVDGPTLVTLSKTELRSELGIVSLPARRYLWELIKSLKEEQYTSDYSAAIQAHEEEIQTFSSAVSSMATSNDMEGPDAASGGEKSSAFSALDHAAVVTELVTDAQRQRQLIEDHLMAYRVQRATKCGQQIYEDAEVARQEQDRLHQLFVQAESDLQYAESLATTRERSAVRARRQQEQNPARAAAQVTLLGTDLDDDRAVNRISSLFGLSVQACAANKINVAEAFRTGKIKPIPQPIVVSDGLSESSEDDDDDDDIDSFQDRKPAAKVVAEPLSKLPFVTQCNVCYEDKVKGYSLACGHRQCTRCTRKLFKAALKDNSLLPLRCCEVPIDMNISRQLLKPGDAALLLKRVEEIEATNKMYCPTCSCFLNLDLIDTSFTSDLICGCGTALCIRCKTIAHPGYSCQENKAIQTGSDDLVMELSRNLGWKQCPKCSMMIELRSGCNHMTCVYCRHEFCYKCLAPWGKSQCSSGNCELWDEDRLLEAGEARVQQEEAARGAALPRAVRQERIRFAMEGLRANEICDHDWTRVNGYHGDCENCGYEMYVYGMRCYSDCGSTVCYTCAHHRIPQRGWR